MADWRMEGKVCLVTGATSGIGEVTARELGRDGARVILHGRSPSSAEAARDRISKVAPGARIETITADLGSLEGVRTLAKEVLERWDRLDVLVNNAGAIQEKRRMTADGIEMTFGVNHLAPFLLTHLLLDRLRASAPARIVNVASAAHYRGHLDLDDVGAKRSYQGWQQYCNSKLCNVLFTYELARRTEGSGVTVNSVHPGTVTTGFGRNTPGIFKFLVTVAGPFMLTPEKGARSMLRCVRAPELATVSGKYFHSDGTERRSSRQSRDPEVQRRLWEISESMTGIA